MLFKGRIFFLFLTIELICSCVSVKTMDNSIVFRQYPYTANEEKKNLLLNNYISIKAGMDILTVIEILGHPDEIRYLYEPVKFNPKQIGYTYWYIINRDKETENDQIIRISVSMDFLVTDINHWGFQ